MGAGGGSMIKKSIKKCIFDRDGNLINIGDWDYDIQPVEVYPAIRDEETGEIIREAIIEEVALNPLPDGAYEEEREVEYNDRDGWYIAGQRPKSRLDVLEESQLDLWDLILFGE